MVAEAVIGSREEEVEGSKFVEVGYISTTHGIRGELRVVSSTDFPELRFFKVLKQNRKRTIFFIRNMASFCFLDF